MPRTVTREQDTSPQPSERLWPEGTLRVAGGTCPGCAGASHPGRSCIGLSTAEVVDILGELPATVSIETVRR